MYRDERTAEINELIPAVKVTNEGKPDIILEKVREVVEVNEDRK